jgi:LysR family transcriptional regulator, hydrogen peroxide-inducible genes activator
VLLLEDGQGLRTQALTLCQRSRARVGERIQASSLGTLVQMVANGLGITLLPATAFDVEIRPRSGIAVRPFAPPPPARTVGLAWRRESARGPEFRRLGALLRRSLPAALRTRAAVIALPPAPGPIG